MFKRSNFCHVASNNRNNVKAGLFVYRTTDDLATVTASGYFNDMIIDINLHDLIIHEKIDATDNTKVQRNVLCVTEKTLENIGTTVIPSQWEEDIGETFVKVDGTSVMSGALKFSAGSMRGAIAGGFNGVTFFKMDTQGNLTQIGSLSDSQFIPAGDNTLDIGTNLRKIERIFLGKVNNGYDIDVPVTNSADTLALKSQVDDAANSGEQLYATGVWYAKMYAGTTPPAEAEVEGRNYADFSQVDGDNEPIIVVYTYTSGAWTETATITPPKNHNGYMTITSKIWDISEQSGQQGGLVLWSHNQGTFTPYPKIISFENINVTGDSTVVMPANPSAQQIVNKDYVDNTVFGQTANTDLSNLTSVGQNIGNWSSNVSNCITNIPQDIQLELDTATHSIILKAGSKVYVPNDIDVYDELVIASDLTLGPIGTATTSQLLYVTSDGTALATGASSVSGTSVPASYSGYYWNLSTNKINSYNSGTVGPQYSLPIAQIHRTSGNWDLIEIEFNGFGYMGSTAFVLPGVSVLIPDYRNDDGTLKSTHFTTTAVSTNTETGTGSFDFLINDSGQLVNSVQRIYDATRNVMYGVTDKTIRNECMCGKYTRASGVISNFSINPVFQAVDYSKIGSACLPTNKYYINITLGASGTTYVAPDDGWIYIRKQATAASQYIVLIKNFITGSDTTKEAGVMWAQAASDLYVNMPVSKGEIFGVNYTAAGTSANNYFIFVPTNAATNITAVNI